MKTTRIFLAMGALALGSHAFAHGDHGPPPQVATCKKECSKDEVADGAKKFLPTMIAESNLDASWKDVAVLATEKKEFGKRTEWVVTFNNPKVADKAKQTIYIFVTLNGQLAGANFTGK